MGAVSQEQMEQGHGVFMAHLLDALEGEAANPRTGRITLGTLYDYLDETIERTEPQYPQKFGYEHGSMILIEWAEWKTASAPQPLTKGRDRKSTRLNSSHTVISYAV